MKRLLLLLSLSGALMSAAELSGVQTVYLMPMARGLDQYLANRLATEHVFRVVTDPKLADAVFSDRFGSSFQAQLDALMPPPATDKPKDEDQEAGDTASLVTETANKLTNPALTSSFGRSKGTVFLVDTQSRQVVWSTYQVPRNATSKELDRTASDIVSRIKGDRKKVASRHVKHAAPVDAAPEAAAPVNPPATAPVSAAPANPPATAPASPAPAAPPATAPPAPAPQKK